MIVLQTGITEIRKAINSVATKYNLVVQATRREGTNMYTFWPVDVCSFPAALLKTRVFYRPETETYDVCVLD
jgi:hypothetical protein